MNSRNLFLLELREKLVLAETVLKAEKSHLRTTEEVFTKEKDEASEELGAEKLKIYKNEQKIKRERELLKKKKANYDALLKDMRALNEQKQNLRKEINKILSDREATRDKLIFQKEELEKQYIRLSKDEDAIKMANKCTKNYLDDELRTVKTANDLKFEEEAKALAKESGEKSSALLDNLKDMGGEIRSTKQKEIEKLQETLFKLTEEYEKIQTRNKDFEAEIKYLQEECLTFP